MVLRAEKVWSGWRAGHRYENQQSENPEV